MPRRFEMKIPDHQLYELVRDVALSLQPEEPWTVSMRAFDRARRERRPDAPSADAICKRLRYPWPDLLTLIFDESRDNEHAVATRGRREFRDRLELDEIVSALQVVEAQAGQTSETPASYAVGRQQLVSADGRAWLHGGRLDAVLPAAGQIEYSLRQLELSWDNAREAAGLARRQRVGSTPGLPIAEAVDMFIGELGYLPTKPQIKAYAHAKGFSMETPPHPYEPVFTEVRRRRRERGLGTPRRRVRGTLDASQIEPLDMAAELTAPRRKDWIYDNCIEGLVIALREARGRALTQRLLNQLAKGRADIPSYSVVERAAKREEKPGFKAMRTEAARRLAIAERS